jgi:lipopolysaccharide export LptBFGC system permease protein LptF
LKSLIYKNDVPRRAALPQIISRIYGRGKNIITLTAQSKSMSEIVDAAARALGKRFQRFQYPKNCFRRLNSFRQITGLNKIGQISETLQNGSRMKIFRARRYAANWDLSRKSELPRQSEGKWIFINRRFRNYSNNCFYNSLRLTYAGVESFRALDFNPWNLRYSE